MAQTCEGPPRWGSADGPEINCNALDRQHFIDPKAATQAQNQRIARLRRQRLVERAHQLGPNPLYHLLTDLDRGKPVWPTVEEYAALPADFIKSLGGDKFPPPFLRLIDGDER